MAWSAAGGEGVYALIEQVMFFVLGLLTAGLIALMVTPAIWRRAVRLTRTRIERSVPMTLAEIQADKDQLRAEFAMSTRRLELTIERLKERAAEQLVEINDKRELIAKLTAEHSGRLDMVRSLDQREAELREQLRLRGEELAASSSDLATMQTRLAERTRALAMLEDQHSQVLETSRNQSSQIDTLRASATASDRDNATALAEAQAQLSEREVELAAERMRLTDLQAQISKLESDRATQSGTIEIKDRELNRLRADLAILTDARAKTDARLAEMETGRVEAEAQAARLGLRLEEQSQRTPSDEVRKALEAYEAEKAEIEQRLSKLIEERDQLKAENADLRRSSAEDWEAERMENALLRERLNDIATQVARVTHAMEASAETVSAVQEPAPPVRLARAQKQQAAEEPARAAEDAGEAEDASPQKSLGDRVRALRSSASG